MYRKTHQCDSDFGKCQKEYKSIRDSYCRHAYNDEFDNVSIDRSANYPKYNSIESQTSSAQLLMSEPNIPLLDQLDDVRFDPTNFTQVEDMLLPRENEDFFSSVFWHFENTFEDNTPLLPDSNPPLLPDSSSPQDPINFLLSDIPSTNDCHYMQFEDPHSSVCPKSFENALVYSRSSPSSIVHTSGSENTDVNGILEGKVQEDFSPPTMLSKPGRKPAPLKLTEDEKYILKNEGVVIPENVRTLTKTEERHIKQVKRRIKNKISAAESRKRKKDYLDGLEERVEHTTSLNCELHQRVGQLEEENIDLLNTVKRMKSFILNRMPKISEYNSAFLLFIFAFALFSVPSWIALSNTIIQPHIFHHKRISLISRTLLSEEYSLDA